MRDEDAFDAIVASFQAATQSLEAVRRLLISLVSIDEIESVEAPGHLLDSGCLHLEAIDVTTMADAGPSFLCPDCGEQVS